MEAGTAGELIHLELGRLLLRAKGVYNPLAEISSVIRGILAAKSGFRDFFFSATSFFRDLFLCLLGPGFSGGQGKLDFAASFFAASFSQLLFRSFFSRAACNL